MYLEKKGEKEVVRIKIASNPKLSNEQLKNLVCLYFVLLFSIHPIYKT